MKNLNLTTLHSELLFDIAAAHLEWYKQFYHDPPDFDILLELNTVKLSYHMHDKITDSEITNILRNMLSGYINKMKINNNYNEV